MGVALKQPERAKKKNENDDFYITSDGKPVAETETYLRQMFYNIDALDIYFGDRDDVYMCGNNFIHYKKGSATHYVAPDCYVVFGVKKKIRANYKVWEESGKTPAIVFEFTSRSTMKEDRDEKRPLYETVLKVPEYILFDPTGDYLVPRFQGFRLDTEGKYQRIPLENDRMYSEQLHLWMVQKGETMRFFDAKTNAFLLTHTELEAARKAADLLAAQEMQARQEAEQRNHELEAELMRLRAELEARSQDGGA